MPQTIRIRPETRQALAEIARAESTTMTKVLDMMVDSYRRKTFLERTNAAFAALRNNRKAWDEEIAERRAWDVTFADSGDVE